MDAEFDDRVWQTIFTVSRPGGATSSVPIYRTWPVTTTTSKTIGLFVWVHFTLFIFRIFLFFVDFLWHLSRFYVVHNTVMDFIFAVAFVLLDLQITKTIKKKEKKTFINFSTNSQLNEFVFFLINLQFFPDEKLYFLFSEIANDFLTKIYWNLFMFSMKTKCHFFN